MPVRSPALLAALALGALPLAGCRSAAPASAAAPTVVVVVRHAEKAAAPADDPPLTPAGGTRAAALADAAGPVDAVFVSSFRRTAETAAPLAARRGLTPVVVDARGGSGALVDSTAARVRRLGPGRRVLVVGHSNTVGPLVRALGGPDLAPIPDCEHSRLVVVTLGPTTTAETRRYGPADPPGCVAP